MEATSLQLMLAFLLGILIGIIVGQGLMVRVGGYQIKVVWNNDGVLIILMLLASFAFGAFLIYIFG